MEVGQAHLIPGLQALSEDLLLQVPFVTVRCSVLHPGLSLAPLQVHDYMYLLRSASLAMSTLGRMGMMYLAAAVMYPLHCSCRCGAQCGVGQVSDFYVPFEAMAEHKMQSSAGAPVRHNALMFA